GSSDLDDIGAGDEHVAGLVDLDHEVGDGRRVDGTAGARAHDHRDLGHHPRCPHVPLEDSAVAVERSHPLLDPRSARVFEADDRCPDLERHVHQLADLVGHGGAQAPPEHGEVLGVDEHGAAVDGPVPGDHRVAERPLLFDAEPGRLVPDEGVYLVERALVEEDLEPFPGRELAQFVLTVHRPLATGVEALFPQLAELFDARLRSHVSTMLDSPGGGVDTPYSLEVHEVVPSTQDLARAGARPGRPAVVVAHRQSHGRGRPAPRRMTAPRGIAVWRAVVVARRQSDGRGRSGAGWMAAPRGMAVPVGFVTDWPQPAMARIPLVAGVAARRVLGESVSLKWPNDVLRAGRKVGGILVEGSESTVVAGMGLNLYWPDPPTGVGALFDRDPGAEEGPLLAERWARELLALVRVGPGEWPRDEYLAACETIGQEVTWEPDGAGRAVGIGADGALLVETPGAQIELRSGEVRHVRRAP